MTDNVILEMDTHQRRSVVLETAYAGDVRRIYAVWRAQTGSSAVAGEILNVLHRKTGMIDPYGLYNLDMANLAAAMRLIEMCANPSLVSDRGLAYDCDGNPLLSDAQVANLEAASDG